MGLFLAMRLHLFKTEPVTSTVAYRLHQRPQSLRVFPPTQILVGLGLYLMAVSKVDQGRAMVARIPSTMELPLIQQTMAT